MREQTQYRLVDDDVRNDLVEHALAVLNRSALSYAFNVAGVQFHARLQDLESFFPLRTPSLQMDGPKPIVGDSWFWASPHVDASAADTIAIKVRVGGYPRLQPSWAAKDLQKAIDQVHCGLATSEPGRALLNQAVPGENPNWMAGAVIAFLLVLLFIVTRSCSRPRSTRSAVRRGWPTSTRGNCASTGGRCGCCPARCQRPAPR